MDYKINESVFREIRRGTVDFVKDLDLKYMVTLNFNELGCELTANQILGRFIKRLNANLFGKRSQKAIRCVPVIERHSSGCFHVHILIEDPASRFGEGAAKSLSEDELKEIIRLVWEGIDSRTASIRKSCPDGKSWFKAVENKKGAIEYVSKQINFFGQNAVQWDLLNKTGRRY